MTPCARYIGDGAPPALFPGNSKLSEAERKRSKELHGKWSEKDVAEHAEQVYQHQEAAEGRGGDDGSGDGDGGQGAGAVVRVRRRVRPGPGAPSPPPPPLLHCALTSPSLCPWPRFRAPLQVPLPADPALTSMDCLVKRVGTDPNAEDDCMCIDPCRRYKTCGECTANKASHMERPPGVDPETWRPPPWAAVGSPYNCGWCQNKCVTGNREGPTIGGDQCLVWQYKTPQCQVRCCRRSNRPHQRALDSRRPLPRPAIFSARRAGGRGRRPVCRQALQRVCAALSVGWVDALHWLLQYGFPLCWRQWRRRQRQRGFRGRALWDQPPRGD